MNILALETASQHCSVALLHQEHITEQFLDSGSRHAEHILPQIQQLLDAQNLKADQLDAIAVDIGPGSFTGIRTGISMAQGLSLGLKLPLIAVSSLQVLAQHSIEQTSLDIIVSTLDARMGEIYWSIFQNKNGLLEALHPASLCKPQDFNLDQLTEYADLKCGIIGSGLNAISGTPLSSGLDSLAHIQQLPDIELRAKHLLAPAQLAFNHGQTHTAQTLQPNYVRNQVADPAAKLKNKRPLS